MLAPPHAFTPAIVLHAAAALTSIVLGGWMFATRKGTPAHRALGRAWVALMVVVAVSTWWIRMSGGFSWIHALSVFVLVKLGIALWAVRNGRVSAHERSMKGIYAFGLITAGAFTLLPQRLLGWHLWHAVGLL